MGHIHVEPTESAELGQCPCCGSNTRRVWGFVHSEEQTLAAYFVQWTIGRVTDHGATFDLVMGRWGDGTSSVDRFLVTLNFRWIETGPAFMVVDSVGRPANNPGLVGRALMRVDVIGHPIASDVFAFTDAILAQDQRTFELMGKERNIRTAP